MMSAASETGSALKKAVVQEQGCCQQQGFAGWILHFSKVHIEGVRRGQEFLHSSSPTFGDEGHSSISVLGINHLQIGLLTCSAAAKTTELAHGAGLTRCSTRHQSGRI
eukprot:Skav221035  [mRNA]  locus=scaffold1448:134670:138547:- [translate_table: standard]